MKHQYKVGDVIKTKKIEFNTLLSFYNKVGIVIEIDTIFDIYKVMFAGLDTEHLVAESEIEYKF